VILLTRNGTVLRIRVDNLQKGNRSSRGKQALELKGDDAVVALTSIAVSVKGEAPAPEEPEEHNGGITEATPAATVEEGAVSLKSTRAPARSGHGSGVGANQEAELDNGNKPKRKATVAEPARAPRVPANPPPSKSKPAEDKQMEIPFAAFKPLPKKK
jgi:hypothetical protein